LALAACQDPNAKKTPEFNVAVEFSAAARSKLSDLGENFRAVAIFDGDSKEGPNQRNAPERAVYLGMTDAFAELGAVAHVPSISYSQKQSQLLVNDEYHLNLSVVSGRRAVSSNLLSCEGPDIILGNKHSALSDPIRIKCSMISEIHSLNRAATSDRH
jgi:hypothetical protein